MTNPTKKHPALPELFPLPFTNVFIFFRKLISSHRNTKNKLPWYVWGTSLLSFALTAQILLFSHYAISIWGQSDFYFPLILSLAFTAFSAGRFFTLKLKKKKTIALFSSLLCWPLLSAVSVPAVYATFAFDGATQIIFFFFVISLCGVSGFILSLFMQLIPTRDELKTFRNSTIIGAVTAAFLFPAIQLINLSSFRLGAIFTLAHACFSSVIFFQYREKLKHHQHYWLAAIAIVSSIVLIYFFFADRFMAFLAFRYFQIKTP